VRRKAARAAAALLCAGVVACGGGPNGPSGPAAPLVFAVSPASGPASGGTPVRITGANFAAGASVTIGGVPAADVIVESSSAITARTGAHAAGAGDVIVIVGGRVASLPGGFTYEVVVSAAPAITAIVAKGTRSNEPAQFADLAELIDITATVQDPDTPLDELKFEWSAEAGTFSGTGPVVKWLAPAAGPTPLQVRITVAVSDPSNRVEGSTIVSLHDSVKEVGDMARRFLLDFSDSTIKDPDAVLRDFSRSARCEGGRSAEKEDVEKNREHYQILDSSVGDASVTFQFAGRPCGALASPPDGDACAAVPTRWRSLCLKTFDECTAGDIGTIAGTDFVTAVFEQSQWRLCASDYKGDGPLRPNFIR